MVRRPVFAMWSVSLAAAILWAASLPQDSVLAAGETQAAAAADRQVPQGTAPADPAQLRLVVNSYCVGCHNSRLLTGGLALDQVDVSRPEHRADLWEKVIQKLRAGDMPPAGRPRPDPATYLQLVSHLQRSLDAAASKNPHPGRPILHRLNRTEYANAVRELFDLDVDVESLLPPDDSTHGFDNIADALNVSPLLLESYVVAARKISRVAVGNPSIPAFTETHMAAHDETQDYHEAGMPLGTRGGLLARQHFPANGEYEIRIKLERSQLQQIRGLQEPHDLELAIDGKLIKLFHLDGGPHMYAQKVYDGETLSLTADENLHVRVPVNAGPHDVRATFRLKTSAIDEGFSKPSVRSYIGTNSVDGMPAVSKIMVTGPFDATRATGTSTRARIFTCQPANQAEEQACAKAILSPLARRAYRGLSTEAAVKDLLTFFAAGRRDGGGFDAGIEMALQRLLAGPEFIYRFEVDPAGVAPGSVYRISDHELASRLSFFLWSSIPDNELLDLADRGQLKQPKVLEQQVRRMLRDQRARALVENFAGQWLYLRNLDSVVPDPRVYPDFDNNLRRAFRRETELLFEAIMREDRSLVDFLDADFTFVDERLALHYRIPNVKGSDFRRVTIADPNRRGLLGHASILTVTSYANRTSPVLRGKWILENILGTPPPPPPPNVPDLEENDKEAGKVLTMRERMARHRANPVCASCHAKMDPIGFGMETFDAVGAWRATEGGVPIDASGALPNGTAFQGPGELRQALMQHPEVFVGTLTAKLLTYALGRGIAYFDAPAVREIVRGSERSRYSFSSVVLGIVNSVPFQMRQAAEGTPPSVH